MPLRLADPDPYSHQIALLHLATLNSSRTGNPVYLGMCDCTKARMAGILIISETPTARCIFCDKLNRLEAMPRPRMKWRKTY